MSAPPVSLTPNTKVEDMVWFEVRWTSDLSESHCLHKSPQTKVSDLGTEVWDPGFKHPCIYPLKFLT